MTKSVGFHLKGIVQFPSKKKKSTVQYMILRLLNEYIEIYKFILNIWYTSKYTLLQIYKWYDLILSTIKKKP